MFSTLKRIKRYRWGKPLSFGSIWAKNMSETIKISGLSITIRKYRTAACLTNLADTLEFCHVLTLYHFKCIYKIHNEIQGENKRWKSMRLADGTYTNQEQTHEHIKRNYKLSPIHRMNDSWICHQNLNRKGPVICKRNGILTQNL